MNHFIGRFPFLRTHAATAFSCVIVAFGILEAAFAYEPIVEKRTFSMPSFRTQGGDVVKELKVGWESYGEMNAKKDNVILITHFFSGDSHAAGRYAPDDPYPGYWDAIIGAGKAIDTDKYFVLSVDSLVNLSVHNPRVVTTGPATINPETGEPYGMSFPIVTIRDFVEVQRALLDELGVKKLHAVMGASMGSLQAYEWAAAYPGRVERLIPVIGAGWAHGDLIAWLNVWSAPIKLDPNWNGGDYYNAAPPRDGLKESLKLVSLHARHWEWANAAYGRDWAEAKKNPATGFDKTFAIEAFLEETAEARSRYADANHFLYLAKANQLFRAGHRGDGTENDARAGLKRINAPTLIIHQDEDLIFPGDVVRETAAVIAADGTPVEIFELAGESGHLDGVYAIAQASEVVRAFLERPVGRESQR